MPGKKLTCRFTLKDKDDWRKPGYAAKLVKTLHKSLDAYTNSRTPERLEDISKKVGTVWKSVFDIENAASPPRKLELAEEILLRPEMMKLLLMVFRLVQLEVKRKIRDLYLFVIQWGSNDTADCSMPRTKEKPSPKVRDLLFDCREEISEIIAEGHDEPGSARIYNDILREFVKDEACLDSLLIHHGLDTIGFAKKPNGCTWQIFLRLEMKERITHLDNFDVTAATFDALEMIFLSKHKCMTAFLEKYFLQFTFVCRNLIDCANFYVQARALRFLYNLINANRGDKLRWRFLCEPVFVRAVLFCLRSTRAVVRAEAVPFVEMILEFHFNPKPVYEFIMNNRFNLLKYCAKYAPKHNYDGSRYEQDDARFARIAYKVMHLEYGPRLPKAQKEFEEGARLQAKMREEQTVATSFQDFIDGLPTTRHKFNYRLPKLMEPFREPMQLGAPPAPAPPNTAASTLAPSTSDA